MDGLSEKLPMPPADAGLSVTVEVRRVRHLFFGFRLGPWFIGLVWTRDEPNSEVLSPEEGR